MLIEFTVSNFRSFKEPVTLSLAATSTHARDPKVNRNNTIEIDEALTLLTSAGIYGANASGKSNLVDAIAFMRRFVLTSSRDMQIAEKIDVQNFRLSTETENQPSLFEVVFLLEGVKYRYGFEVDPERVVSEWLFYVPTIREARLFIREGVSIQVSRKFKEGRGLEEKTRPNALFLSVAAQFNGPISKLVFGWFREVGIISGLNDFGYRGFTLNQFRKDRFQDEIVDLVKKLDLDIVDIQVEQTGRVKSAVKPLFSIAVNAPDELQESLQQKLEQVFGKADIQQTEIHTLHTKYDSAGKPISLESFDLDDHESEGTQKLFFLSGPLIDTLSTGRVLFIDEMEARMHTLVTREIIRLFNSLETNPKRAQLVFTTHDTNLLSNKLFRRDQIWFIEKDQVGASHLYSLAELKVRNDASFENDYMQGRYGAVPVLGSLCEIIIGEDEG